MIIIDNFLPKDYYTQLYALVMSGDFDWYHSHATIVQPLYGKNIKESVRDLLKNYHSEKQNGKKIETNINI